MKNQTISKKRLANRLAGTVAVILLLVFALYIFITFLIGMNVIQKSVFSEMRAISKSNALNADHYFDTASKTTTYIKNYVENMYKDALEDTRTFAIDNKSKVMPSIQLNDRAFLIENFMIETSIQTIKNNNFINSIGIAFEPHMFTNDMESYSVQVEFDGAAEVFSNYGEYSEYSLFDTYQSAASNETIQFTNPYDQNGKFTVTGSMPVYHEEQLIAVIMMNLDAESFKSIDTADFRYSSAYAAIITDDGTIAYQSKDETIVNQRLKDIIRSEDYEAYTSGRESDQAFDQKVKSDNRTMYQYYHPIHAGNQIWMAVTTISQSDTISDANYITLLLTLIEVVALIVIITAVLKLMRYMLSPIGEMLFVAKNIAEGNLDVDMNTGIGGEIGELADSFQKTIVFLKAMITDLNYILTEVSVNNFAVQPNVEYIGDFAAVEDSLTKILHNLNAAVGEIRTSSVHVSSGAEQLALASQSLAEGTSNQASSVEEMYALIQEVSNQVENNADKAKEATVMAKAVGNEVLKTNEEMQGMSDAMTDITAASNQIERITQTIEEIASQTNLLSLNAAIEAARAGESGRGFAVVADRIRELASQSAEAARSTRELIAASIDAVESGSNAASAMEQSIQGLAERIKESVAIIEKINEAAALQTEAISQVTKGVGQISSVIESNSAVAEEAAATSEELSAQAQASEDMVSRFILIKQ